MLLSSSNDGSKGTRRQVIEQSKERRNQRFDGLYARSTHHQDDDCNGQTFQILLELEISIRCDKGIEPGRRERKQLAVLRP